jgi:hypothetical protein
MLYFENMLFSGDQDSMRRRIGLGCAALFLFSVSWVYAQTAQTPTLPAKDPAAQAMGLMVSAPNPFDSFQQFSASVSGGPLRWNKRKIYRSGKLMRGEYEAEDEVRITDSAHRNGWVIRPRVWITKPRTCAPMTLMDVSSYPFLAYTGKEFSVERPAVEPTPAVEKETIDGHSCKVENYAFKHKDSAITIKVKLWEAEDLKGFPVKMEIEPSSRPKFTFTYTDVSVEPPNPKLFQLPVMCHAGVQGKKKTAATSPKAPGAKSPAAK